MRLVCLHGFLGAPRDWDGFARGIARSVPAPSEVIRADLFGVDAFVDTKTISEWAAVYCEQEKNARAKASPNGSNYLIGYSLGGRLALHMAVQCPDLWDGIIIIGANPGLDSEQIRAERRARDEQWAQRFETEPWDDLLKSWDAQPVFAGKVSALPARREQDFSRPLLAGALRRWSLGAQMPVWICLERMNSPVLWVAGADDIGQKPICARLQNTVPSAEIWVAPGAGHRVPWEQPEAFTGRVAKFITKTQGRKDGE